MSILVISPHPDDESIGMGGTIRKHVTEGDTVDIIFLTSGEKGGHGRNEEETMRIREKEARKAAKILEINSVEFWKQPDGKCEANIANIERMAAKLRVFLPAIIYVTHEGEQHPDHRAAAEIVMQAVTALRKNERPLVYMYEVWTPLSALDYIVDISEYVPIKRKAIKAHKSQCNNLKFHVSAMALNRYRGEMHSWPGGDYAEVFKEMKL